MTYLPPDGGLSHLLSVVSDAQAVQQRIKQLQDATKEHTDAVLKHQELSRVLDIAEKAQSAAFTRFEREKAAHNDQVAVDKAYIQDRKQELDKTILDIQARNENLKQREEAVKQKAYQLDQMAAQLVNREVDISTRTKMVEGREQQVQQHLERHKALVDHMRQHGFLNI